MRLSCKLSNTAISFLVSEGLDATEFVLELPWSESLLTDPGQTLPAEEMELFFTHFVRWFEQKKQMSTSSSFLQEVGHRSIKLRTWGILDSVLRMMPDVHEVWMRPSKLLGHFIDPEPIVTQIEKQRQQISFNVVGMCEQYPLSCRVLQGSLEVIPLYMGAEKARCYREDTRFIFDWGTRQQEIAPAPPSLESSVSTGSLDEGVLSALPSHNEATQVPMFASDTEVALSNEEALFHSLILSPEAFREMVAVVEKPLKPGRRRKATSPSEGPKQLLLDQQWESEASLDTDESDVDLDILQQNLHRAFDFFVRASQLVTLLQQDPEQSKEWLRRVHWEKIREEFPALFEDSVRLIKKLKNS